MEFYRLRDVPKQPGEIICRQTVMPKVIGAVLTFAMSVTLLWFAWQGGIPHEKLADVPPFFLRLFGGMLLLMALFIRGQAKAAMRPATSWLVRVGLHGITVKFRSYLNHHLPFGDVVAFALGLHEVEWVRPVRETRLTPGSKSGETRITFYRHLEIKPTGSVNLEELAGHLARERSAKATGMKRWYGSTSWKSNDYPVVVTDAGTIRVHWTVRPKLARLMEMLKTRMAVQPLHKEKNDFTGGRKQSAEEALKAVQRLAQSESMAAVKAARRGLGLSLSEARGLVDALAAGAAPQAGEDVTGFIAKAARRDTARTGR